MKRRPNTDLIAKIGLYDWGKSCGKPLPCPEDVDCRAAETWHEACQLSGRSMWENAELEARNQLTVFLALSFPEEDRQWNDVTDDARVGFVDNELPMKLRVALRRHGLQPVPKSIVDSVQWNILAAIMEDAYGDLNPPRFFTKLLPIYEAGHLPCGWEGGEYPEGRLIIY
jgi:hypothetical protein